MAFKIDYDRGVLKRIEPVSKLEVYMYVDTPGVYLNAHGTPVAEALGKSAGFPVEFYAKQRVRKERMAQAMDAISTELDLVENVTTVVREKGGFKIVDIGLGRHQVHDPDGDNLTKEPLTAQQADLVLDQLVPSIKETKDATGKSNS